MSRSLNKVMLLGNVGNEPEVQTLASGGKVVKFSLATSRTYTDRSDQKQEKTEWHRVSAFGKLAEIIEKYVHKGDKLYVEGRIEYSESEDGNGGKRFWTNIIAGEMVMLGSSNGGGANNGGGERRSAGSARPAAAAAQPFDDQDDSDLPF